MPITAASLIDSLHHNANVAPFRMDDHAAAQIESDMRFIVGMVVHICAVVSAVDA